MYHRQGSIVFEEVTVVASDAGVIANLMARVVFQIVAEQAKAHVELFKPTWNNKKNFCYF